MLTIYYTYGKLSIFQLLKKTVVWKSLNKMFAFKKIINRDFDENLITIPDRPDELYYRKK